MAQSSHFVDVLVDPHTELPSGMCMRFKAQGQAWPVAVVCYEPDDGPHGQWLVSGCGPDGETAAQAVTVDDSSAGTSTLIWGGSHGLLLRLASDPSVESREAYLLLAPQEVVR
ncbi:MAG: hypothetical protein EXR77_17570 [Myxococcales bacterium]|nr:hypothetical protein [Myxococcales bacterium]